MNKFSTVALGGLLAASMSSAAYAEPTRTFFTETADVAAKGSVSLDMEYPFDNNGTGIGTGVRIGAMGGEILLNNSNSAGPNGEFVSNSIGYKKTIQKNLAAYGILNYYNDDAFGDAVTDIALGVAFTLEQKQMTININGELITDDSGTLRGDETTIFLKGSLKVSMDQVLPNSSFIAELALEDNDFIETASAFGIRWQPSKRVTTDLIVYIDNGDPASEKITGIPGYIKLNLAF